MANSNNGLQVQMVEQLNDLIAHRLETVRVYICWLATCTVAEQIQSDDAVSFG
ncbi:hypothetical protein FOTG_05158 [Fusarium oxysporum f. sp. vasinfectum 25433]|uniref:Uncharacterized protein n=1 Tax=Fusarium oxysporum f. sp. vasinfectum 25433 TaxID=1089449 RepID=X0N8C6_FUSOX|nr:hypothetical protein FOTG_05158 [Fusarium oxysporum f. sp. vasinfectum 25433]